MSTERTHGADQAVTREAPRGAHHGLVGGRIDTPPSGPSRVLGGYRWVDERGDAQTVAVLATSVDRHTPRFTRSAVQRSNEGHLSVKLGDGGATRRSAGPARQPAQQALVDEEYGRRSRPTPPTGRELLPARWWLTPCSRKVRCSRPYCASCRTRALQRSLAAPEAAFVTMREDFDLSAYFVTVGRVGHVRNPLQLLMMQAGVRVLDAELRLAGAHGITWVYEVKPSDEMGGTRVACCAEPISKDEEGRTQVCPLCHGSGRLPTGHFHAHGIMLWEPSTWSSPNPRVWGPGQVARRVQGELRKRWLHNWSRGNEFAPLGHVDFRRLDGRRSAFAYLAGYVQRQQKEPRGPAWLRRMAPRVRLIERTGCFRGTVNTVRRRANGGQVVVHEVCADGIHREPDLPMTVRQQRSRLRKRVRNGT